MRIFIHEHMSQAKIVYHRLHILVAEQSKPRQLASGHAVPGLVIRQNAFLSRRPGPRIPCQVPQKETSL